MADASDPLLLNFATRLRDRQLYKCFDVRRFVAHAVDPMSEQSADKIDVVDLCCKRINQKLTQWEGGKTAVVPRLLTDEAARSPYKTSGESIGPLDRINVRTEGGALVDLKQRSKVVAALTDYKLYRVYYSHDDTEAREHISKATRRR